MTTSYRYSVVAWLAEENPAITDGDILGEWIADSIADAEKAMWSELHGIFHGEFPEDRAIIIEIRQLVESPRSESLW